MWRVPSSSLLLLACIVLGAFAQDRECVKDDFVLEYSMSFSFLSLLVSVNVFQSNVWI